LRIYEQLEEKRRLTKAANSRANRFLLYIPVVPSSLVSRALPVVFALVVIIQKRLCYFRSIGPLFPFLCPMFQTFPASLIRRSNSKKKKGKAVEMVDLSRPDNVAKEAPPAPTPAPKPGFLEGLLEKTQAAFPEANVMARMQVLFIRSQGLIRVVIPFKATRVLFFHLCNDHSHS